MRPRPFSQHHCNESVACSAPPHCAYLQNRGDTADSYWRIIPVSVSLSPITLRDGHVRCCRTVGVPPAHLSSLKMRHHWENRKSTWTVLLIYVFIIVATWEAFVCCCALNPAKLWHSTCICPRDSHHTVIGNDFI